MDAFIVNLACTISYPRPTMSVGVGRIFESVCLFVRCITRKTNDSKVFKLGIGNNLRISYK